MTMPTEIAEARLRRAVAEAEQTTDQALEASAKLMLEMIAARRATGSASHMGQTAISSLAKSMPSLVEFQHGVLRTHRELARLLPETAGVDEEYCPPNTAQDLSQVA